MHRIYDGSQVVVQMGRAARMVVERANTADEMAFLRP